MHTIGERKFVELAGERTHELPPLLVRSIPSHPSPQRAQKLLDQAADIVESEDILAPVPLPGSLPGKLNDPHLEILLEQRRYDLALNFIDQYQRFIAQWSWGDSVVEWIRQCEITFTSDVNLRPLLRNDIWPHAGRISFIHLLEDKHVDTAGIPLERAVGLRLTFRQPPPLRCFSDQFLIYLNSAVGDTSYLRWAGMNPTEQADLPPERFHFNVHSMAA
jgi:hypothetical protein